MKIKFPQMIYFIDYGNRHLLIRFRLLPFNQTLFLETSLHELRIKDHNINLQQSFYNDPTDEGLFDRTNKILIESGLMGFNEIIEFRRYIEGIQGIVKTYNELNFIIREKTIKIHFDDYQLYGLQLFVRDLSERYVGYQVSLLEMVTKYKDEIESPEDKIKIEPVRDITELQVEIPPLEIETIITDDDYIQDLLQLSPNNLTTYYISKYIYSNIYLENDIIKIPNFVTFTYQNKIEMLTILHSITYDTNEISSRLKTLYSYLYEFVILKPDTFKANSQNVYLILFLIYIYSVKNHSSAYSKFINFEVDLKDTFVKYLNSLLRMLKLEGNKDILLENITELPQNFSQCKELLEPIVKKYFYLLNVDKELFVKTVIEDLTKTSTEIEMKDKPLLLTKPSVLDINFLITQPSVKPTTDGFTPYIQYNKENITSFYSIIQELSAGKIISNIPTLISKHLQNITNNIFYNIDNDISYINLEPVSTLIIMEKFISPYIEDTNLNKITILFQIVIPYLYDKYKISKFLNYYV